MTRFSRGIIKVVDFRLVQRDIFITPESTKRSICERDADPEKFRGTSKWRVAVFVGLAGVVAAGWCGVLGWSVWSVEEGQDALSKKWVLWKAWTSALVAFSWVYLALYPIFKPRRTPSMLVFALYLAHMAISIISLVMMGYIRTVTGRSASWASPTYIALESLSVAACVLLLTAIMGMPLVDPEITSRLADDAQKDDRVTLFEWITFAWVNPLIKLGFDKDLNDSDVPPLSLTMRTEQVFNSLLAISGPKVDAQGKKHPPPSLLRRLVRLNAMDFFVDASLTCVSVLCNYAGPYLIKRILDSISDPTPETKARAYIYAALALLASLGKAEADLFHLWHGRRESVRVKNQLVAIIYEKALKRKDFSGVVGLGEDKSKDKTGGKDGKGGKKKALNEAAKEAKKPEKNVADTGRVVSLMASDTTRVQNTISGVYFILSGIVEVPVAAVFLYSLLGWSAFAGFVIVIFASPAQRWIMARNIKINQELSKARDRRITVMNELISNIKFIKFFAWIDQWRNKAQQARTVELNLWVKNIYNSLMFSSIYGLGPIFITLISFACFIFIAKGELTVSIAFTALSLFSMLRQPLNMIPAFTVLLLQTKVSLDRIDDFLKEDEVDDWVSSLKSKPALPTDELDTRIGFEKAVFKWHAATKAEQTSQNKPADGASEQTAHPTNGNGAEELPSIEEFELGPMDFIFPHGKLSVISGPTGSGKSALLHALLGEMDCTEGKVFLPKHLDQVCPGTGLRNSLAFCSQTPWLQQMSIRDNILFGEPFEQRRYDDVLEACALVPDLDALDDGDETEIGARGISMSGGQKARLALARAVYSRTQHLLLDDIFAAVDSHTGRHLYEKCVKGPLLHGRTVIIVSHHVELLLPGTDFLVRLLDGRIDTIGDTKQLREQGLLNGLVATEEATAEAEDIKEDGKGIEVDAIDNEDATTKKERPHRKLVKDEERAAGNVEWSTYKLYLQASSYSSWVITVVLLIIVQIFALGERWWLKIWGEAYRYSRLDTLILFATTIVGIHPTGSQVEPHPIQPHFYGYRDSQMTPNVSTSFVQTAGRFPDANSHPGYYLTIFTAIGIVGFVIGLLQSINGMIGGLRASKVIHTRMLNSVLRSTIRFADTTPSGRIINRFSKDIETIDGSLTGSLRQVLVSTASLIGAIILVTGILPWFLVPAAFISYAFYVLSVRYLNVSRDLRRIEATARSPIFSGFGEVLDGITTVRAFSAEKMFKDKLFAQVDHSQAAFYQLWMCNRWLLLRFDALGALSVFAVTCLSLSGAISAGSAGVAITSSQSFVSGCYWISRFWSQLEMDFNAVERAKEYLDLEQEPPAVIESRRPPAYWPSAGTGAFIRVENLTIKYSPELPAVLDNLTFEIKAKEKLGLLGRTGSGKSTLGMYSEPLLNPALLRFTDPSSGKILIDGIDITSIGVDDLRSRITYIPQDAVLFSGTVRENLDPFQECTDQELLEALDRVQLGANTKTPVASHLASRDPSAVRLSEIADDAETASADDSFASMSTPVASGKAKVGLDTEVSAGGLSLSQGQRQLLAMARAMLRRSNLVIADEATASIDMATDIIIQQAIRTEFADACVITIAHRLDTVIDYDRLMVLSDGKIVEFDTPWALIQKEGGAFRSFCEQSGRFNELYQVAQKAAQSKAA
ncbi:hypothetical protein QFC19_001302 [Naganishia cerealis]|uniref:Uncharacterized protein n=1 Tax=Naganishia cerealis TaxID=610337 RepID=A0ACC2WI09_9TREE|nr:hypothetical protein QFC19_001302 [Naganishia cerealis]